MGPPGVLVLDDDAALADMIAEVLVAHGHRAVAITDPVEAVRRAGTETFAAAVVDLVMPRLGGLEVIRALRTRLPDLQVVILTGHADVDSALEGIRHGVFAYIRKTELDFEGLARSVREAVGKWRLLRENRDLIEALTEKNRLLGALHASSGALLAERHLDRVLAQLVAAARETCGAEVARAILFERGASGELVVSRAEGAGETLRGVRLRPGEGLSALALELDETQRIEGDPRAHPRFDARIDALPAVGTGFLAAPLRHGQVTGVVVAAGGVRRAFGPAEQEALTILARQAALAIDNTLHRERGENFFVHASEILVEFIDAIDVHYPGHSRGVALLADMISRRMGLSDAERRNVHFGALLHDIGKVRLGPALLGATGPLSPDDRRRVEQHPALGLELLRPISVWEEVLAIVHSHHERWDGKGYPRHLAAEEIPLGARIVAVAEVFDVMARSTPHAYARRAEGPVAELEACSGTQFDPLVVRLFIADLRDRGDPRAGS